MKLKNVVLGLGISAMLWLGTFVVGLPTYVRAEVIHVKCAQSQETCVDLGGGSRVVGTATDVTISR